MINVEYSGLWGASKSYFLAKNAEKSKKYLIITDDFIYDRTLNELKFFLTNHKLLPFPSYLHEPFEKTRIIPAIVGERLESIYKSLEEDSFILLSNIYAITKKLPPQEVLTSSIFQLKKSGTFDRDELIYYLDYLGYVQVEIVTDPGEEF